MDKVIKNIPVSILRRLKNLQKERSIEFQKMLVLYGQERLLYRISISRFSSQFVLKGASLFALWLSEPHRRTKDIDLLGKFAGDGMVADEPTLEKFAAMFQEICQIQVEEDGMVFQTDSLRVSPIRTETEFGGVRILLRGALDSAIIPLQVDIGFGDATIPEPQLADFPTLLKGLNAPRLMAYQKETSIAEKLHAIVHLKRDNTRMKDFFDLYILFQEFAFEKETLHQAILYTFQKRGTALPTQVPDGLTQEFANDSTKMAQWKSFLKENVPPPNNTLVLSEVIAVVASFLLPLLGIEPLPENAPTLPPKLSTEQSELPTESELSAEQAAQFMGVSHPYLLGLLEEGKIPLRNTGAQHPIHADDLRIHLDDLRTYIEQYQKEAHQALDERVAENPKLGLDD
jgi:predicted nucleotidyltransferase component of viral defense system